MLSLIKDPWNAVFHPVSRLPYDFPLTGAKLGKSYFVSLLWLTAGTIAPLVALMAYALVFVAFYKIGLKGIANAMLSVMQDESGQLRASVIGVLFLLSGVTGLGLQFRYLARVLRRTGHSLFQCIGLGLGYMRKSTWAKTLWAIAWRALLCFVFIQGFAQCISLAFTGQPALPAIGIFKELTGGNVLAQIIVTCVIAPPLEEIAFRGFLYQSLRATFHNWRVAALGDGTSGKSPGWFLRKFGPWLFEAESDVEVSAVCISAALFALQHMQFAPLSFLFVFGGGVILAELFRRTASLWPGIALHCLNNTALTIWVLHSM